MGPNSADAAAAATMLGGLTAPIGLYEGAGLPELHEDEYRAQFRDAPCSGIIYTPQQLSDHVAVALALAHEAFGTGSAVLASDSATRLSQPHRTVTRISA